MELSDKELLFLAKSAGITVDHIAQKLDRLPQHKKAEALTELELGRVLKVKLDHEHSKRLGLVV